MQPNFECFPCPGDCSLERRQVMVVFNYDVRIGHAFRVGKLGSDASTRGFGIKSIARSQPLHGRFWFDNHDPDLVAEVLPAGFEQNCRFQHDEPIARDLELCQLPAGEVANAGPHNIGELLEFFWLAENFSAEDFAVDRAVRSYEVVAERADNGGERVRPWFVCAVAEYVGVDHRYFAVVE